MEQSGVKLTKAQRDLLVYLAETPDGYAACERVCHPNTGARWPDEQVQRRRYWTPALKALGLRQRDAYQTRHTFASLALMGGINIGYLAGQLGHAKITTTLNTYARWIDGADKGAEAKKLDAILSNNRPRQEAQR
jgi:integrase